MYGVHRTCAETAAVPCGTSHASAVSTPLWWIFKKTRYKKLVVHVESHARAVSLLESGESRYTGVFDTGAQLVASVLSFRFSPDFYESWDLYRIMITISVIKMSGMKGKRSVFLKLKSALLFCAWLVCRGCVFFPQCLRDRLLAGRPDLPVACLASSLLALS